MSAGAVLRAMRPKQWTKNAVVLAALVFALGDPAQHVGGDALGTSILRALAAAALFCLASSAIYLMNDVRDADLDRAHPVKRLRPVASGELSPAFASLLAVVLAAGALALAFLLDRSYAVVLAGYLALQVAYTMLLKRIALVDIFVIAIGFVLRALAGAVVLHVRISPWLLLCTLLLALFLALCKRRHELAVQSGATDDTRPSLRGYDRALLDILIPMVAAATLVCYSLYTLWPETVLKFGTEKLGFTIPFVIYGLFRYLDLVYRRDEGGRPEQLLLTDPPLLVTVALYSLTTLAILLAR